MGKDFFSGLSDEEKEIIVNKGTERPFSGEYNDYSLEGVFSCRACGSFLFESDSKFDSGCGWPSFDDEITDAIVRYEDNSLFRKRVEICCAKCDGHLGHVFHGEKATMKDTRHCVNSLSIKFINKNRIEKVTLGAGCFWKVEKLFSEIKGVYNVKSGYMGGDIPNPTYEAVCSGETNHIEVVEIYFDPSILTFLELLVFFWSNHNPSSVDSQNGDNGIQYRSVIFCHSKIQLEQALKSKDEYQKNIDKKIVTSILEADVFYKAEEYHQDYLNKNNLGSCSV